MNLATVLKSQWDRIAAVACVVLGLVLLAHGYHGIANSPYVAEQLAYLISEGLGGMFALGVGATLYVSADLHDEWRKLERIEEAILRLDPNYTGSDLDARFEAMVAPVAQERARRRGNSSPANAAAGAHVATRNAQVAAMPREMLDSLRVGAVAGALALLGLILSWWKAAEASTAAPAFTATAIAALVLSIAGLVAVLGTVGNRRRLMRRRMTLLQAFVMRGGPQAAVAVASELRMPERLLVIPDGRFAHAAGCTMLGSEPTRAVASDALPEGILPCALCTPAGL